MARTVRTVRKSKEEVHYPRHVKELCQIMEEAKEQGQLRAVMEEEFKKPVSMTGIWECRSYFHMEDENGYEGDTVLLSIRALLATMEGKLKFLTRQFLFIRLWCFTQHIRITACLF